MNQNQKMLEVVYVKHQGIPLVLQINVKDRQAEKHCIVLGDSLQSNKKVSLTKEVILE